MSTAGDLAAEQEKISQEALKRQKEEEEALLKSYQLSSQDIYGKSKDTASQILDLNKSGIEALYGTGYEDLKNLVGEESEAAIKESLRPIENKLANQGLLGGPSGALNEALAGAAERVRNQGISRLADFQNLKTGALANTYSDTARQLSALEQLYGAQNQGLLASILQQNLSTTGKATDLADKYGFEGLQAALGTNKISVETEAAKDIAKNQAALDAEAVAAAERTKKSELLTRQTAWDRQYQTIRDQYYNVYRSTGWSDTIAMRQATTDTLRELGPRP